MNARKTMPLQISILIVLCLSSGAVWSCVPPSPPPVAVLTISPARAFLGETVLLDGSASYAPSSYITKYEWDFTNNGTYDYYETATYRPDGTYDGKTTHTYPQITTYTIKLKVTNSYGLIDTETATVGIDPNNLIIYTYDGIGKRTSMTDPSGATSYGHDALGRLLSVTRTSSYVVYDELGLWPTTIPYDKTISYEYDTNGNRIQMTDPNGNITAYAYDAMNRLTSLTILGSQLVTNGGFDDSSNWTINGGNYFSIHDGAAFYAAAVMHDTQLSQYGHLFTAGTKYQVTFELSQVSGLSGPDEGVYISFGGAIPPVGGAKRNADGTYTELLTPQVDLSNIVFNVYHVTPASFKIDNVSVREVTAETNYQYDSLGNLRRTDLPNGTYTEYVYDPNRTWLSSVVNYEPNDAVMSSYSYTYDNVGNRLSVTEADNSVVSYTYDDIYQLSNETRIGTNAYSITYQYDEVGNRTQMVKDSVTTSYTYNANNQLLTETAGGTTITYDYDGNGNLWARWCPGTPTSYRRWDGLNRLQRVYEPTGTLYTVFEYDGDGNRISKTQGDVKTKYINDVARGLVQVLQETDNTGATQATYTYGNDLIAMTRISEIGEIRGFYHYDGLGTTRQLTDDSGTVVANYVYDAFGNSVVSVFSVANTYGFTGEQQFAEADDLVFLRARYYNPRFGRFISRDPILTPMQKGAHVRWLLLYSGLIYNPQFLHPYAYVQNNPVIYLDPYGLMYGPNEQQIEWCSIECFKVAHHIHPTISQSAGIASCQACCRAAALGLETFTDAAGEEVSLILEPLCDKNFSDYVGKACGSKVGGAGKVGNEKMIYVQMLFTIITTFIAIKRIYCRYRCSPNKNV